MTEYERIAKKIKAITDKAQRDKDSKIKRVVKKK